MGSKVFQVDVLALVAFGGRERGAPGTMATNLFYTLRKWRKMSLISDFEEPSHFHGAIIKFGDSCDDG